MENPTQTNEPNKQIFVDPTTYKSLEELAKNKNMTIQEYVEFLFKSVTVFNSEPEPNEALIEVPLTLEQSVKMKTWIDGKDFIEVLMGSGETKAMLINSRLLWRKNHPDWQHEEIGEPVQLQITVMSPFLDFIKEYMRFFGCKDKLETFCMKAIYAEVQRLNGALEKFAGTHGLMTSDWLARFNERTHGPDPDEENDC